MTLLSKLLLILGVASITYGAARWQVVSEILSKQEKHFDEFFITHAGADTNTMKDVFQLRRLVLAAAGHPKAGYIQRIVPFAFGFILLAVSYYFDQKGRGVAHEPVVFNDRTKG